MLKNADRIVSQLATVVMVAVMGLGVSQAETRVYTLAGGGVGDGGSPGAGILNSPRFAAYDSLGNLYVTDYEAHRIRKVTSTKITTVAGTGISGFSGDGGAATSAMISFPNGIAVDSGNNVYFADSGNNRIRKIDTTGTITTFAGTGVAGYSGDGGPASQAQLNSPSGILVDSSGNMYIADTLNQRVRKIDTTGTITTIAGNGTAGFSGDGGLATAASLNVPLAVAIDRGNSIYIADSNNLRIRKVLASTGTIVTYAGNGMMGCTGDGGAATSASIGNPGGVAIGGGNLYIAGNGCSRIRAVNGSGIISLKAGSTSGYDGGNLPFLTSQFQEPRGLTFDRQSNLVAVDTGNNRVRKLQNSTGKVLNVAGGAINDGKSGALAGLNQPTQIATDASNNTLIADSFNNRIRSIPEAGTPITTIAGNGISGYAGDGGLATAALLSAPYGIATDVNNNIFISDQFGTVVREIVANGKTISTIAQSNGTFVSLTQISVDASDNVYGTDPSSCVIWKVTPTGVISVVAGELGMCGYNGDGIAGTSAMLNNPEGVAIDGTNGNMYISDTFNHRIRKVDSHTGLISTISGNGTCGFSGDGGPASSAQVCSPTGMTVYKGAVFFADTGNYRLREIDKNSNMSTLAGSGLPGYDGDGLLESQTNLDFPYGVAVYKLPGFPLVSDLVQNRVRDVK